VGGEGALPRDLVRAMAWSRAHLREPLRLGALAGAAGVPPRTLESCCRKIPVAFGACPWYHAYVDYHSRRQKVHIICMEEVLAVMACIPGLTIATYKLKAWWHARHFKKHHKPFQPKDCPHDHSNC